MNRYINKPNCLKVKETKKFLNSSQLSRKSTNAKIIGITGSAGKTSTKFIGDLLKNYGKTYYSPRSYNNDLGVPLALAI